LSEWQHRILWRSDTPIRFISNISQCRDDRRHDARRRVASIVLYGVLRLLLDLYGVLCRGRDDRRRDSRRRFANVASNGISRSPSLYFETYRLRGDWRPNALRRCVRVLFHRVPRLLFASVEILCRRHDDSRRDARRLFASVVSNG
jgi:hypothetical protein